MQRQDSQDIIYSPSDLVTFLHCHHATFLDVRSFDQAIKPAEPSEMEKLLQEIGLQHEAAYLQYLISLGNKVVEIPKHHNLQNRVKMTFDAMRSGVDIIYQATFFSTTEKNGKHIKWQGAADFLIKCNTPSDLGNFSYEVLDTKLARKPDPKHIMQLCAYSELLAQLQSTLPTQMYLLLGNNEKQVFRLDDFYAYYQYAKRRFENYIPNLPFDSYPEPCQYCDRCQWRDICNQRWEKDDHLIFIANIRRSQIHKLQAAGIGTVAALAMTKADSKIPDLNPETFARLRSQAMLQHHKSITGEDKYEIINFPSGKGFTRLPKPDDGDIFFDIEGDPLYLHGLEYLFGIYYDKGGEMQFEPFWAHDHKEEKKTFERFMGFLATHLAKYPHCHIYHYNHYETTALKRLACRYATCEEQLDNLLRGKKFVDLYQVVRESMQTSEMGYSLKNLETFYKAQRVDNVATATDSIIIYNQWCKTHIDSLLDDIAKYNQEDCISTYLMRQWLLSLKPKSMAWSQIALQNSVKLERKAWEIEYEKYQTDLKRGKKTPSLFDERLLYLLEFHRREEKPQWWGSFDRQNKQPEELIDDIECLGGLELMGDAKQDKESLVYHYSFLAQEHKLRVGAYAVNTATMENIGKIAAIDENNLIIKIKCTAHKPALPNKLSIGPPPPINTQPLRSSIYSYADHILMPQQLPHVATELLNRNLPVIKGKTTHENIITSPNLTADALKAIGGLDNSYLFIQGPPGAGKTYTSGCLIVDLIMRGKKIGVTSNSHKAIHNLLKQVEDIAIKKSVKFTGIKKATENNETVFKGKFIHSETKYKNIDLNADLFAGTAWAFAHPHFTHHLDYLFIDEAGQVAIANVVAMTNATKNIILVGDQMQLGQPIQGTHPGEAGLSVLEFLLGDNATISPERGIFLPETRRMRQSICKFISDVFYDGRLTSHISTADRYLELKATDLPNEGIVVIPVDHKGCSQKSHAEGEIIKAKYQALLGQNFTDSDANQKTISEQDILVVTPYNMQVNYLLSILPPKARVGTVDKFQGQEAPIVLISMVTSSAEDISRNIEFLYSKNRLNVAISRAQCLAVVVLNPTLLEIPCKNIEQIKLVNVFCRLYEYAHPDTM
ncbi:MAG: TM0106 family RecB-like putative nuclease [Alphaproteobacteria bacterium]